MRKNSIFKTSDFSEDIINQLSKDKKALGAFETLISVSKGELAVFKDTVLSFQDTTRDNYPFIIKAFFKDISKSADMIIKSLLLAKEHALLKDLLLDDIHIAGHRVGVRNEDLISINIKEQTESFFEKCVTGYKAAEKLYEENKTRIVPALKNSQNTINPFTPLASLAEYTLRLHPAKTGTDFKDKIEKTSIHAQGNDVEAVGFVCKKRDSLWDLIYHSSNLYDEGMTPKKTLMTKIDGADDLVCFSGGCNITERKLSLSWEATPNYSMKYYIEKAIVESITGKDMLEYMTVAKDYLSRIKYFIETVDGNSSYSETHPFVVSTEKVKKFEAAVGRLRKAYENHVISIQEIVDRNSSEQFSAESARWGSFVERYTGERPAFIKGEGEISAIDLLGQINNCAIDELDSILGEHMKDDVFLEAKQEEQYIHKTIKSILDHFYNIGYESSGSSIELFKKQVTFHEVKAGSVVFDFREGKDYLNEEGLRHIKSKPMLKEIYEAAKFHPYHDFYEFDGDVLQGNSEMDLEEILYLLKHTSKLKLPIRKKCGFKLRKLGNYKASGIYFSFTRMLGLDYRSLKRSYIHEIAHHIDLNGTFYGRYRLVKNLRSFFRGRITKRADYFLDDSELIARAAEISMLLEHGNYRHHVKNFMGNALVDAIKRDFEASIVSKYMTDWDYYMSQEEYLPIPEMIMYNDFQLIDEIVKYFKPFWSYRIAKTGEDIESIGASLNDKDKFYSRSHKSYGYYLTEIYKVKYDDFEKDDYMDLLTSFLKEKLEA